MRETGYYTGSEGQFLCAEDFRALSVPLKVKAEQQSLKHADETSLSPASPITPPTQPSPPLTSPAGILQFRQVSYGLIQNQFMLLLLLIMAVASLFWPTESLVVFIVSGSKLHWHITPD